MANRRRLRADRRRPRADRGRSRADQDLWRADQDVWRADQDLWRAERHLQPQNLAPRLPQAEGEDGFLIQVGEEEKTSLVQKDAVLEQEKASLVQKVAGLELEKASLKQKLASLQQENASLKQENASVQQDYASLQQQLASLQQMIDLRQLMTVFKKEPQGKAILEKLLAWIREKNPTFNTIPSDITFAPDKVLLKDKKSFLVMVIHLATLKSELQKEMKDVKLTKEIAFINSRLSILKTYAEKFKDTEMGWNEAIGKGFYSWCLLVADANEMCHPDMSEECLKDMRKSAAKREYNYEEVELGPVIEAVIKNICMYREFKNGASSS